MKMGNLFERNVNLLLRYIDSIKDFQLVAPDIPYGNIGATIVDAMLQAGLKWETVVKPRVLRIKNDFPDACTATGFLNVLETFGPKKTLCWKHSDKPNRIVEITKFFVKEGVETEADLRNWIQNISNTEKLRTLKGVGNKTVDYFNLMVGIPTAAIDRHLLKFLHNAGIETNDYFEAKEIIHLAADARGIDRTTLDHSIWKYMSERKRDKRLCISKNKGKDFTACEGQMESLHEFVVRLSKAVECYYHSTTKAPLYSLKKYDTDEHGKMGVFGWVRELRRKNSFEISTYWYLADMAGVAELADLIKDGMHFISKDNDPEGKGTGIAIYVKNGSNGVDYQKAVKVLRAVMLEK